jgi:hypothetical protein
MGMIFGIVGVLLKLKLTRAGFDVGFRYACNLPLCHRRIHFGFLTPVLGGPGSFAWSALFHARRSVLRIHSLRFAREWRIRDTAGRIVCQLALFRGSRS